METSESIKNIAEAMVQFHKEVESIPKTANNPYFKSKYAPLDKILTAIKEPLANSGLSVMQFPAGDSNLTTIVMHISGEWIKETYSMKPETSKPQALGSVITYQRRYALSAILALDTDEDDDGNEASKESEKKSEAQNPTAKNPEKKPASKKEVLTPEHKKWQDAIDYIANKNGTVAEIKKNYEITEQHIEELLFAAEVNSK